MKELILLLAFFAIAQIGFSQKVKAYKVSQAVKTEFAKKFPTAELEGWELEDGNYEAEFDNPDDVEMSAVFSADGKWLETKQVIKKSELPAPVLAKLQGKKVKEASKIMRADGSTIYEAEVKRKDLLFDASGNAVKLTPSKQVRLCQKSRCIDFNQFLFYSRSVRLARFLKHGYSGLRLIGAPHPRVFAAKPTARAGLPDERVAKQLQKNYKDEITLFNSFSFVHLSI